MYVYERMTKRPTTVTEDYSIAQAYQIMNECRYSQLPVVDSENKLVGLLTEKVMAEYSPSKATSLSMYELGYILTKTKVKDVMARKVFTVTKDTFIEEAAVIMKENRRVQVCRDCLKK
ncbi:MAG: CBS domain-containing protein, partial [Lachnospirales bacterium]